MKNKNSLGAGLILLFAGIGAATAADKESIAGQAQYQVKDQTTATVHLNTKAAAHANLPATARGVDSIKNNKTPGGLARPGVEQFEAVGRAAAMAEQARGLREAQQAVKEMANIQGVKNLGDLDNLGAPLGGSQGKNPLDRLGTKQPGGGMPDYMTKSPFGNSAFGMPKPTDPDAPRGNRSSPYAGGSLMPPSPRDVARGGGLASQDNNGQTREYVHHHPEGNTTYTESTPNADGGATNDSATYDKNGRLTSFHQTNVDADGNINHRFHAEVDYPENGADPVIRTDWSFGDGPPQSKDRGHAPTDPPLRQEDYGFAGMPTTDPYGPGSGGDYCPPYLAGCQWEADAARRSQQSPNRVNPGTADNLARPQAPRLAVDTQGLVTNPDPTGGADGGFNPPAGWRTGENGTPGGHPGSPGGMPPRPGSEP